MPDLFGMDFHRLTMNGFSGKTAPDYGHETIMRNFIMDPAPQIGWSADFLCDDPQPYHRKRQEYTFEIYLID